MDAIDTARKAGVRDTKRGLPYLREGSVSWLLRQKPDEPTIENSGKMKLTASVSVLESMKTTTRFPLSIISPSVGQSD
jgi:hypothetical protein